MELRSVFSSESAGLALGLSVVLLLQQPSSTQSFQPLPPLKLLNCLGGRLPRCSSPRQQRTLAGSKLQLHHIFSILVLSKWFLKSDSWPYARTGTFSN